MSQYDPKFDYPPAKGKGGYDNDLHPSVYPSVCSSVTLVRSITPKLFKDFVETS